MIAVDCEMSGLDPKKHSILSIGAVDLENPERKFYGECFLPDYKTFDPIALSINGFTEDQIFDKNKKSLNALMQEFLNWVELSVEKTLVGQNVSLDRDFLNIAFFESNIPFNFHYRCLDLHSACLSIFLARNIPLNIDSETKMIKMSLDKIAESLGMPAEPRPHNALTGATYNTEIFYRLIHQKNVIQDFESFPVMIF